jgi:hypothetical protein
MLLPRGGRCIILRIVVVRDLPPPSLIQGFDIVNIFFKRPVDGELNN